MFMEKQIEGLDEMHAREIKAQQKLHSEALQRTRWHERCNAFLFFVTCVVVFSILVRVWVSTVYDVMLIEEHVANKAQRLAQEQIMREFEHEYGFTQQPISLSYTRNA